MSYVDEENYFYELKEWSERKLKILEDYLEGAVKIMQIINDVYYADCFAGRGTYGRPGEQTISGSPLQAAKLAQSYIDAGKPYSLRCINVESNHDNFLALQSVMEPFRHISLNLQGTFTDNIDRVLSELRHYPAICFLDPFGVKGMDWWAVRKLINRPQATDLWIRFDVDKVLRRAGWYNRQHDPAWQAHFDVLMRTYGANDAEKLYNTIEGHPTAAERKQAALDLYMELIRNELRRVKRDAYVYAYRIGTIEEQTKYYLIFASANPKGGVLACDVVHNNEENYQKAIEQSKPWLQMMMFDPSEDDIFKAKVEGIKEALLLIYRGKTVSRLLMRAKLLDEWFGSMKGKHMTRALQELIKDGYILSHRGQVSDDKSTFTFRS